MGKNKIEIERIQNAKRRQVTLCKRRQGLFKKAESLCKLCNAEIVVLAFSEHGKSYEFGSSSVQTVVDRYLKSSDVSNKNSLVVVYDDHHNANEGTKKEEGNKKGEFWWENVDLSEFDTLDKLQKLDVDLKCLREKVSSRVASEVGMNSVVDHAAEESSALVTMKEGKEEETWWGSLENILDNNDVVEDGSSLFSDDFAAFGNDYVFSNKGNVGDIDLEGRSEEECYYMDEEIAALFNSLPHPSYSSLLDICVG
ncbi:hypothetical protein IFM89_005952 [Coptis chinensis]|uniref:MADS-box domain-containing protein n=1 Tax=Coptis chinensis TaxID=261450 RepID=A0A835M755_9MAGN|nr:hypothetical protein IFM89_005952 [Coptis chinensis]